MSLPYAEPLVPRQPGPRQIPEPPRRGEPGGPPCAICAGETTSAVWLDGNWTLHAPRPLGMLEAEGMMLPLWEDALPNVPDEELAAAAKRVAAAM